LTPSPGGDDPVAIIDYGPRKGILSTSRSEPPGGRRRPPWQAACGVAESPEIVGGAGEDFPLPRLTGRIDSATILVAVGACLPRSHSSGASAQRFLQEGTGGTSDSRICFALFEHVCSLKTE